MPEGNLKPTRCCPAIRCEWRENGFLPSRASDLRKQQRLAPKEKKIVPAKGFSRRQPSVGARIFHEFFFFQGVVIFINFFPFKMYVDNDDTEENGAAEKRNSED